MDAQGNLVTFPFFSIWENGPVALGWLRVSHRELDTERSTPQQPWLTLLVEGRWDDDNEEILTVVRQELNDGAGSNLINLSSGTRIDQLVNAAAVASHQGASPGKLTPSSSNGSRTR